MKENETITITLETFEMWLDDLMDGAAAWVMTDMMREYKIKILNDIRHWPECEKCNRPLSTNEIRSTSPLCRHCIDLQISNL